MKTSRIDLPSSLGKGNEFLIRGKNRASVQLEGEGYTLREWRFPDCNSLAENANNIKIWNNVMDHFPHPYTKREAMDQECRIYSGSCVTKSCYQKRTADRFLLFQ
ncbi:hypothetical protein [Odoribacter laneus]|uniref:hypothetical protein n=1 Tax=Odoribacter laneus TaxID=626933 RepID=UPI003AB80B0B